jgi:hypothetical protein
MARVGALVFKHRVDLSLIKPSRKMRRKYDPAPQQTDRRGRRIPLIGNQ